MGEFSPVQLDALEDALEDLELSGIPGDLEDDVAVAGRLGEYRDLLVLSREALPPLDVPAGILDGVLAAAREEAVAAVPDSPREAKADDAAKPWWQRFSLWMPMLAVGASAALVLIMVRGTLSTDAEPAATVAKADAKDDDKRAAEAPAPEKTRALLDDADELQAVAEPAAAANEDGLALGGLEQRGRLRGAAAVDKDASDLDANAFADGEADERKAETSKPPESEAPEVPVPAEAEPEPEPEPAPEPTDKVVYDGKAKGGSKNSAPSKPKPEAKPKPKKKPSSSSTSGKKSEPKSAGGAGVPGGVPGGVPDSTKDADPLASAERNRTQGRCSSARSVYRSHLDDTDAAVRARALAGMGLCALADGDEKAADDYFKRAKSADGSVSGFISRERSKLDSRANQSQNQTKKKK